MTKPENNEERAEQELHDEALEEVAGGIVDDCIQIGPPPFFPETDSV